MKEVSRSNWQRLNRIAIVRFRRFLAVNLKIIDTEIKKNVTFYFHMNCGYIVTLFQTIIKCDIIRGPTKGNNEIEKKFSMPE